jgi:hypothetical protein
VGSFGVDSFVLIEGGVQKYFGVNFDNNGALIIETAWEGGYWVSIPAPKKSVKVNQNM